MRTSTAGTAAEAVRRASAGAATRTIPDGTANGSRSRFVQRVFRTRPEDVLPLAVRHQRIYVLPTQRGCAFLAALLLMLVASINYSLSLGYALSFLLTGLFAATLLHTYRNLAGLEILDVRAGAAFAGDPLAFTIGLADGAGHGRTGIALRTRDGAACVGDVPVAGRTAPELAVATGARGVRPLGRLTLSSDWPLGLWRTWSYVHASGAALVWPRPEADAPPLPVGGRGDGDGARVPTSEGDVAGLAAYSPGDPPSRIAWKSAARGTGLKVRIFDDESVTATVLLRLDAAGAGGLEARLSRLTAWVLEAERSGTDYALELPGTTLPAGRGAAHRTSALDALARVGGSAA